MPYRRNNFDLVVDSSFQPFTMQEMLVPFMAYKDTFEKQEAAYDELNQKEGDFSYLASTLPEGSKARAIYEGYANDLKAQAEDFSKNGLSMGNRRALLGLKRRYSGEIGRLEKADAAMQEEKKLRRQMSSKDPSMLYAMDNLSIDSFLDGETPNLYSVSGDDLYKRGAQAAASASSRIFDNTEISNLTKYYQEIVQRQGYSPELLAEFRSRMEAIPELQQAVEGILQEKGVNGNLTGMNYERARQSVINGILDGAVYKEARSVKDNPGVLTAAQAASNALGWANHNLHAEQRDFERAISGYEKDENGKWVYNMDKDQSVAKAKAIAAVKGTKVDANGNPVTTAKSTKTPTRKLKEARSYDGKGNIKPIRGQNVSYGTPITYAEAVALDPTVAQHDPGYEDNYEYFKNGKSVSIVPDPNANSAQEDTSVDTGDDNQL